MSAGSASSIAQASSTSSLPRSVRSRTVSRRALSKMLSRGLQFWASACIRKSCATDVVTEMLDRSTPARGMVCPYRPQAFGRSHTRVQDPCCNQPGVRRLPPARKHHKRKACSSASWARCSREAFPALIEFRQEYTSGRMDGARDFCRDLSKWKNAHLCAARN